MHLEPGRLCPRLHLLCHRAVRFERHLDSGEIMAQVAYAQAFLRQIGMPGTPAI